MSTKSLLSLSCALGLLCLGGQANAALIVTNGDFSNLAGLTSPGAPWYSGVPTGWNTDFTNTIYTVEYTGNPSPGVYTYIANLSQLSSVSPTFAALNQSVGTTAFTGDVTLTFDLTGFNGAINRVGAAIYQGPAFNAVLANQEYTDVTGTFQLTAPNVASGTPIQIGFWTNAGTPALTNVSISQVPEPGTWALLMVAGGVGMLGILRRRSRQA
jgi:hypothetical protein